MEMTGYVGQLGDSVIIEGSSPIYIPNEGVAHTIPDLNMKLMIN